jgi:hypothetical protein
MEYELYHFDSDESCASDFADESYEFDHFYDKEPDTFFTDMLLPCDIIREIMYHCDMNTFINLHFVAKKFRILCDYPLWEKKMNHIDATISFHPSNYEGWIQLYKNYLNDMKLYNNAATLIDLFKHAPCTNRGCNADYILIKLNKTITVNNYYRLITKSCDEHYVIANSNNYDINCLRMTLKNIFNPSKFLLSVFNNDLNYTQSKQLFFYLFYYEHLDQNYSYFFNDYGYLVTENDHYYGNLKKY